MARVTVEDCVDKVPNRFELVLLAARRARNIHSGAPLTLDRDNDKNPVVALREIAEETIDLEALKYELEHGADIDLELDEPEEENLAVQSAEKAWAGVTTAQVPEDDAAEAAAGRRGRGGLSANCPARNSEGAFPKSFTDKPSA